MHNFFPARKHLLKQCNVIFSQAMPGDLKRKNSRTATPFWPQRDLIVVGSRVDASGQRSIERNLIPYFFFGRESFMSMSNVFLQVKKERDIGVLLLARTRNILVPKTELITPKNYGFFSKDYCLAL